MCTISTSFLAAVCLLATAGNPLAADDKPIDDESRYVAPPWHLIDIWWDIGKDVPFESYSLDIDISDDVPSSSRLYIAPVGLGHLGKTAFYGGIQTQADGHTRKDQKVRKIGPGLIFSMWGERSLDAIRPAVGGFCQSSGHEGDFVSVRRAYPWNKGKYTFRVVRMDREEVEGKPFTWVGVFVYSHEKDENVFAGALRFPGENLVLSRKVASFVEVYGPRIPVADIPRVTVAFGNLKVNGKPVERPPATAFYLEKVPDYAEAKAGDGAVIIRVGQKVEGRTERRVELLKR